MRSNGTNFFLVVLGSVSLALGCGGSSVEDAGSSPEDAGSSPEDADSSPEDAGPSPEDAGSSPEDASTPEDATTSPEDAGTRPTTENDQLATCGASPAMWARTTTADAFYDASEGAWLGCPDYELPQDFGPRIAGAVGLEISRDGTYTILVRATDGSVERGTGIDYTGTWYLSTSDGMVETDHTMAVPSSGGGTSFYRPQFTEDPRQLRIDEGLVLFYWSRYVPVDLP